MPHHKPLTGLTIFFPCYNDSATIATMVVKAMVVGSKLTDDLEVIVIDDASRDGSDRVLEELCRVYRNLRVIRNKRNTGYGAVLRTGFANASKDFIFYTDGDAQYDVFELESLVPHMKDGIDIVNGYKIKRRDPLIRKVIGNLYHTANSLVLGIKIRDVDCDFRLIRRTVFDVVRLRSSGGEICVEFIKKCQEAGMRFAEVAVQHYYRKSGASQFFVLPRLVGAVRGVLGLWKEFLFKRND